MLYVPTLRRWLPAVASISEAGGGEEMLLLLTIQDRKKELRSKTRKQKRTGKYVDKNSSESGADQSEVFVSVPLLSITPRLVSCASSSFPALREECCLTPTDMDEATYYSVGHSSVPEFQASQRSYVTEAMLSGGTVSPFAKSSASPPRRGYGGGSRRHHHPPEKTSLLSSPAGGMVNQTNSPYASPFIYSREEMYDCVATVKVSRFPFEVSAFSTFSAEETSPARKELGGPGFTPASSMRSNAGTSKATDQKADDNSVWFLRCRNLRGFTSFLRQYVVVYESVKPLLLAAVCSSPPPSMGVSVSQGGVYSRRSTQPPSFVSSFASSLSSSFSAVATPMWWKDFVLYQGNPSRSLPYAMVPPVLWWPLHSYASVELFACERCRVVVEKLKRWTGPSVLQRNGKDARILYTSQHVPRHCAGDSDSFGSLSAVGTDWRDQWRRKPGEERKPNVVRGSKAQPNSGGHTSFRAFLCVTDGHLLLINSFGTTKLVVPMEDVRSVIFPPVDDPVLLPFLCLVVRAPEDLTGQEDLAVTVSMLPFLTSVCAAPPLSPSTSKAPPPAAASKQHSTVPGYGSSKAGDVEIEGELFQRMVHVMSLLVTLFPHRCVRHSTTTISSKKSEMHPALVSVLKEIRHTCEEETEPDDSVENHSRSSSTCLATIPVDRFAFAECCFSAVPLLLRGDSVASLEEDPLVEGRGRSVEEGDHGAMIEMVLSRRLIEMEEPHLTDKEAEQQVAEEMDVDDSDSDEQDDEEGESIEFVPMLPVRRQSNFIPPHMRRTHVR